jgi:hypothetical protein
MITKLSKGMLFFMLGILFSQFITPLPSLAYTDVPLGNNHPIDQLSPGDWIKEEEILVTNDRVIINIKNAKWAKFADTKSMDPVFDQGNFAIQVIPKIEQLQLGDIISYRPKNKDFLIIHRIIEMGEDEEGWYVITKGDNNPKPDPERVRADQVEKVVVGIIY